MMPLREVQETLPFLEQLALGGSSPVLGGLGPRVWKVKSFTHIEKCVHLKPARLLPDLSGLVLLVLGYLGIL